MRKLDVLRLSKSHWRAVGDDPQFVFSFGPFRPRFLLLYLEAVEQGLDPMLYFNRGRGFSEDDSVALPYDGPSVFVISASALPNVAGVRLDPATRPLTFNFWARSIYRTSTLKALASRLATTAVKAGRNPPKWISIGEQYSISPPTAELGAAPNIRSHFDFVFQLAEVQLSDDGQASRERDADAPLISLVTPVFNAPASYLKDLVESFKNQAVDDAELILVDDGSTSADTCKALARLSGVAGVRCISNEKNEGIAVATNRGLDHARGRWIGFIDHDDALAPLALKRIKQAFRQFPEAKFFYTDEVVTDAKLQPTGYILKPSFDEVLLSGVNYINHLSLYRRDVLASIGKLRSGLDGSQDYDLLLRYVSRLACDEIVHVPYPAYLWRRSAATFSTVNQDRSLQNARRALADHFQAVGDVPIEPALDSTLHRPRFDATVRQWPPVTVVIPSRNAYTLISEVLDGLRRRTDYPDLRIVVVDNGSDDSRVLQLYDSLRRSDPRFRAFVDPQPFNFSRQVNFGCRQAGPGHVLLLNNDIEIIEADWLQEMVSGLSYPGVGIVGARLLYPDRTLQHAGVVVGLGSLAGHWFERKPHFHPGPFGRLRVRQSLSAVTAACMLIERSCLDEVGEFDESRFAIAYNDVDYCLRAAERGFRTVWTPNATLVHHESASRGSDETPQNQARFAREKDALRERHRTEGFVDPYFSPWYTRHHSSPGLALLSSLPSARSGRRYGRD